MVLTAFIWVIILVVVGVLSLGVCCVVKLVVVKLVVVVVIMVVVVLVGVVVVVVTGNERATKTTFNTITNTKTPDTPINQVNK